MEYRKLGETDIQLSAITFGAWAIGGWMWGGSERTEAVEAIRASYEQGVTSIDTAPVYGQGLSEEIVGESIKDIPRDKVQILTKYGMRWDEKKGTLSIKSEDNSGSPIEIYKYAGKDSIVRECEESLRRLQTDYIDVYQIHWPDITTPVDETMEAVATLLRQGKIRAAGVSNYAAEQMKEAEKAIKLCSNQVPYSMVERKIEKELVPYCIQNNKSIIAYSPLQRGLLSGKIKPGHQFAKGDHRPGTVFYKDENLQRINAFLDNLRPLASEKKASLSQVVIRWTIEQPGITVALVGSRNAEQAIENAQAIHIRLSAGEIADINEQLDALELK